MKTIALRNRSQDGGGVAHSLRAFTRSLVAGVFIAALAGCGGGGGGGHSSDPAPTPEDKFSAIPTPVITGPVVSEPFTSETNNYTFFASDVALVSHGYVEEEFYMDGKANRYDAPTSVPSTLPTANAEVVQEDVPYKTRIVVRRPADAAKFNGTVVVEWFNVTDNFDGEYYWVQAKDYLLRAGYAYIGVSAQNVGITNNNAIGGLKKFSPTRYDSLDVTNNGALTGDPLSYDIFSQTAKAAYAVSAVMGGLQVKHTIGIGMSQSGSRLGIYTNYIHMRAPIYDAFIIQVSNPRIRDDFDTPVIKVLSESEGGSSNGLGVNNQADLPLRHTWWVAGTNHGDSIQRLGRTGVRLRDIGPALTTNDNCTSTVTGLPTPSRTRTPYRHVLNAALHHLVIQIETGTVPPDGARFNTVDNGGTLSIVRDIYGNALGGIRLAHMDVPTARANGSECGNIGGWTPFDTATLQSLYPTHADYVAQVKNAVNASIAAGFVLPEDGAETVAEAEASVIGMGLECSPERCLSIRHFTADYSTTGLLRDHTVYYNIVDGEDILRAVDTAHFYAANGDTLLGTQPAYAAQYYYTYAISNLRQYIALITQAQAEGRVTETAGELLKAEADNVIRAIEAAL
ncbi:MAG: hypothetical protein LBS49_14295 [Candidatus Accumulibacter sp.]|nr:hypothetical protein [Accumulibacter sp.]